MQRLLSLLRKLFRRAFNAPGWETALSLRSLRGASLLPSKGQWSTFFRSLTVRERILFTAGASFLLTAVLLTGMRFYFTHTVLVPANGGNITIGIVGAPLHPNPILAPSNPADADLVQLIYAGLYRYDENGKLLPYLAESSALGDFGKIVDITLRENIVWPDGKPFIADDVVFTVESIQDPSIRSPLFPSWNGVKTEVIDHRTVRFTLPAPYPLFLHNLTVGILPKHQWQDIDPKNLALSEQNLKPMGLGPFRAVRFERNRNGDILSYTFERNRFATMQPFVDHLTLQFFENIDMAITSFNRREIIYVSPVAFGIREELRSGAKLSSPALPRTHTLFLNQTTSKPLSNKVVRAALAYAVNRTPLIEALGGPDYATALERPIPYPLLGATDQTERYDFAQDHSRNTLEADGWLPGESGVRAKKDERLAFTLIIRDTPELKRIAEMLAGQLKEIGVAIEVQPLDAAAYRKAIIERNYQILLAGIELPMDPDPYAFWHSSQKFDPGGNIALYDNKDADALLEEGRSAFEDTQRAEKYAAFQKILMNDIPAIFLWQERYVLATGSTLRGTETAILPGPAWRLGTAAMWYTQTKRVWR